MKVAAAAPPAALQPAPSVMVWSCRHAEGLFSMMSLALGHAKYLLERGWGLYVDWSHQSLLYKGPPGHANVWTALWKQPAEVAGFGTGRELELAASTARLPVTTRNDIVFGRFCGVIESYGPITPEGAALGRDLCRRCIQPSDAMSQKISGLIASLLGDNRRWLAVHVRRSDKGVEAASNLALTDEDILNAIAAQCSAWGMTGVFLCSDDGAFKERMQPLIRGIPGPMGDGLAVRTYQAALSRVPGQATHFDKSVDAWRRAEDVVLETYLMAQGCHGLISTYSNVSATVVYLSPEWYPFTMFSKVA